jgi:hypothetical protein
MISHTEYTKVRVRRVSDADQHPIASMPEEEKKSPVHKGDLTFDLP